MDEKDEIDLIWICNSPINVSKKYENQEHEDNSLIDVKSSENIFPWLSKFNKIMCSSVGHRNYQLLKHLLFLYTQNILTSINTYREKTLDMIKLKTHLRNTLIFFHLYWNDIKEHVSDCNLYLSEMSVILGIYIDIELKTSKHTMDSSKLASKLLSALWIYLSNSEKHIFRVLLKLKFTTKKYAKVCDLIFMKSFANFTKNVDSLTDVDYVRYLLFLKVWKRIKETVEEKRQLNKKALTILGPCIPKMRDELLNIIPKAPTGLENETIWLLQSNAFDLKTACNNFLVFEETMFAEFKETPLTRTSELNFQLSQNLSYDVHKFFASYELKKSHIGNLENNYSFEENMKNSKISNQQLSLPRKRNKFEKYKKTSKLKPGEVILINLAEEDELGIDKKKKKKRCQRNLEWLKMAKKKYKVQKQIDEIKYRDQIEIADVCSADNFKNCSNNILLGDLPILDNKVSESTASCTSTEQKSVQNNIDNLENILNRIFDKRNTELKCMFQHRWCDTCTSSIKQTDVQCSKILYLLKFLSTVGQNIKEPKAILNLLRESRDENMSSEHSFSFRNTANESNEIDTQGKELFSQPKSSIKTIFLSSECQNNITNVQSMKQQLPINTDCNVIEENTYCQTESAYVQNDDHLHNLRSMSDHNSQVVETMKKNIVQEIHECTGCCKKIEVKPFSYHNNSIFNTIKNEDVTHNTIDNNTIDKTTICDKNIMCMLSDLDKCMDVLNRIGEHIMTIYAEKQRLECLNKMDICTVSTTVLGNQCAESSSSSSSLSSSSDWIQNINSLTNTEKLSKILELYGKKDLLNVCNCQNLHFLNEFHKSIPQSKEYHSYGKNNIFSGSKPSSNLICNHIKSEFEQPIKKENKNLEILKHNIQDTDQHKINVLTNNQTCDISFTHNLENTKESNQDMHWESTLQNLSQEADIEESRSIGEFENITIFDSILYGDEQETIEDEQKIWGDLKSPLIYDNSDSVLHCITEFFSQPEHLHTNEMEEKYILSDAEDSQTLLSEGSFGRTGILNFLFDFYLTNMDSPSNNFMYSNIQAVNPRLIEKSFEEKTAEKNDLENTLSQEDKELCSNQNHSVNNSVDMIGFELDTSREEVFEFLPVIKSTPSFSGQSITLVNSNSILSEEKESFPKCSLSSPTDKFNVGSLKETFYIFQKEDTINQTQSFSDKKNEDLPEICISNNIPSDESMNYILNQQENDIHSLQKYTCVELETSPLVIKESLDSCDLLSSTDLISCNTDTTLQRIEQTDESSLRQKNFQENMQYNCEEKQNHIMKCRTEISGHPQSRSPKQILKCKKKIKTKKKEKQLSSSIVQSNQNELSLRCSQITIVNPLDYEDVQNTCESSLSTFHMSYCQTSPKNGKKQLNCANVQQSKRMSQQKQQIVLNFHEDSMVNSIYKEDSKLQNLQCVMEDNISEDSRMLNVPEKSYATEDNTHFKISKRNMNIDTNITKANFITDNDITEFSNNIKSAKWISQNINVQPSNSIKEQAILDEDIPLKKRKLTSTFSSTVNTNTSVSSVNQQKMQRKHYVSTKKGNYMFDIFGNLPFSLKYESIFNIVIEYYFE
ncbi:uncharacterized protein LOC117237051 isoform X2 [Bombus vosnesenskii]|nr:uncharacterized protein LOC117237051 isoform X2 [Bombus vosnesenskii]